MIEKIMMNKRDTVIFKNAEILGGVFDFNIKVNGNSKGLYEILQDEPWQIINNSIKYVITMKQYTEKFIKADNDTFTLKFVSSNDEVKFIGCKIVGKETYNDASGNLITVSVISAERMC